MFVELMLVLAVGARAAPDSAPPAVDDGVDGCSRAKVAAFVAPGCEGCAKHREDPGHDRTDVRHYRLDVEVDPDAQTLDGRTTMRVASRVDGLDSFRFWLNPSMAISSVTADGRAVDWQRVGSTVDVDLDRTFDSREIFVIVVRYSGTPGPSAWWTSTQGGSPVVSTLSQPWFASDWWPVKDDNSDKATVDLLVTVPSELTVVGNGVLVSVENLAGGKRVFHWSTDYPTSPYLVAFSATAYTTFGDSFFSGDTSMPVEFYIYPGSDTPANRDGWRLAVDMLDTFDGLFGPYPFLAEKYAIYQFPFGGGMEHQTATGQGGNHAFSEPLTAHELAHQWWGDLVTCASWHDIWLNEGFATYSTALWYEFASGTPDAEARRAYMETRRPEQLDGTVYVDDVSDPNRIFSSNYSYSKGAWVVHMLRGVLGDEAFFESLAAYRERHAYSTATTEDLRAVAEEVGGTDLGWFFDEWVYGGGAPAYSYGWREHVVVGRRYLELSLEQTQREAVFAMPLQVATATMGEEQARTVWNFARVQHYLFPVAFPVDTVSVDPDDWVLTRAVTASLFVDGPPKVVAVEPAPGSVLRAGEPLSAAVTFHEDVVIGADDIVLRRDDGTRVELAVAYDAATFTANLASEQPLAFGRYELAVSDAIVDLESGLALDGELDEGGPLPSGDGVPGGSAVVELTVVGSRRPDGRRVPAS